MCAAFTSDKLCVGKAYFNEEIAEIFGCTKQGGMRRSHKTNSMVLIQTYDFSAFNPYEDSWDTKDETLLHYTGTGQIGDQSIEKGPNKALANFADWPNEAGYEPSIHLFIQNISQVYVYYGEVHLEGAPTFASELDTQGNQRQVVKFHLRVNKRLAE